MKIKAIDSHLHLDMLIKNIHDPVSVFEKYRCGLITWCYVDKINSYKEYEHIWEATKKLCHKTSNHIPAFYMVGIHPRSIPEDIGDKIPEEIMKWLEKHISDPLCVGMGELGIDSTEFFDLEEKILRWQLEWAMEHLPEKKRIGIHTPRQNKEKITEKILKILENYPMKERILIDHATPGTWSWIKEQGYMCGITLQPGKCAIKDLEMIAQSHSEIGDYTIINSDSAFEISSVFLSFLEKSPFDLELTKKLLLENSKKFFNLPV